MSFPKESSYLIMSMIRSQDYIYRFFQAHVSEPPEKVTEGLVEITHCSLQFLVVEAIFMQSVVWFAYIPSKTVKIQQRTYQLKKPQMFRWNLPSNEIHRIAPICEHLNDLIHVSHPSRDVSIVDPWPSNKGQRNCSSLGLFKTESQRRAEKSYLENHGR